jgi:signal transduction histidine kinase
MSMSDVSSGSEQKVLVIDDDPAQLATLADILEEEGFLPITCSTGGEALAACGDDVNVAILDLRLPDIDGISLLRELRAKNPNIMAIINTAYATIDSAVSAVNAEVFAYVRKMGSVEELLAHLHRAFHMHFARYSGELEEAVKARTAELVKANEELRNEIAERKRAEDERLQMEHKMQQAQKLESLGVLAGGLAHDFNNLLTGILGNAGLARLDLGEESAAVDCLVDIETTAQRAAELCQQMLAYSGRGTSYVEVLSLTDLVQEMAGLLEVSIPKKVELKYQFNDEMPPIEGDATQLRQVVMNLITNASDSIGDGSGAVVVATGVRDCDERYLSSTYLNEGLKPGPYVFFEVTDTGCGMAEETVLKIFDPFFTTKVTGRGLGLAAVLGIVHNHQAAVRIKSEIDVGTTFTVLFPPCSGQIIEEEPAADDTSEWKSRGTILIADDEPSVRNVSTRILARADFVVLSAENGQQAVEAFHKNQKVIRAVILDVSMPVLSGEEVVREIRKVDKRVPILLASGYSVAEAELRFGDLQIAAFVQKPFRPRDLLRAVRSAIGEGDKPSG